VDRSRPDPAVAALAKVPAGQVVASGGLVCADDLPDGLVMADHVGRIVVFNQAATRLTGVAALNALGRDVRQVLPLRDAEGRGWWACVDPYRGLSTRTRHPELPLYLPDGSEFLVTMGYVRVPRCTPAAGQDWPGPVRPGDVQRLAISLRGTQQRVRLERSRADLVSTVAHELRSPLTSVKGFTATLLAKWTRFTDDQKRVMLETVNADADRVTRLITELLDVSRIEAGRIEVHRQLVDIPQRAEKILAGRVAAGDPPGRFRIVAPEELPETWLDADKVDQILGNLVENAVRHGAGTVTIVIQPVDDLPARAMTHPGGTGAVNGSVAAYGSANASANACAVAVSVRDEGDGVPPEMVPRIFRQFWRAKRRGGAGLGLYIVKGLVEAHGGTITVQRAPGGGAEFRFTMPAGLPDFG
jgi:signal transduction histidine kinase